MNLLKKLQHAILGKPTRKRRKPNRKQTNRKQTNRKPKVKASKKQRIRKQPKRTRRKRRQRGGNYTAAPELIDGVPNPIMNWANNSAEMCNFDALKA
jgi:hypothetical protein